MVEYPQWRGGGTAAHVLRVGRRIEASRHAAGWSQRDLASEIGWHQRSVSAWERGLVMPRIDAQLALASVFDVHPDVLFCWQPNPGELGYKVGSD